SLEQQKKRARELLKDWQTNHTGPNDSPKLSDSQHVIAQQHGFRQWADFKSHIEQATIARDALQSGCASALDAGQRTLHIRCGTDIERGLAIAGFEGDFLCFVDLYVHGPVPRVETFEEFLRIRATAISGLDVTFDEVLARLKNEYNALVRARDYDRVLLWFEHDSHDQLILAKLLDYFSVPERRPRQLQLISVTHFPGVKRFNGIGQLPSDALRVLWQQFMPVTQQQLELGQQAWRAITSPTPADLMQLVDTGTPALPTMGIALQRHAFELPSTENGLSLTEELTLQILKDKGPMNAARLFGWYTNYYEPLPYCGDSSYWQIISRLANTEQPAITIDKKSNNPVDWKVTPTLLVDKLLNNEADWLILNPVRRWVGGVCVDTRNDKLWRINRQTKSVVWGSSF
ncbi:DUF1835 domain-containing protein, partial [Kaarinaea lacus]